MLKINKGCAIHKISWILLIIGGLNAGLIGLSTLMQTGSSWDVLGRIFGQWPTFLAIVYVLIGLSAVAMLFAHKCKQCKKMGDGA